MSAIEEESDEDEEEEEESSFHALDDFRGFPDFIEGTGGLELQASSSDSSGGLDFGGLLDFMVGAGGLELPLASRKVRRAHHLCKASSWEGLRLHSWLHALASGSFL